MIHVATVHWCDPKWIGPQARALTSHITGSYRTYANLQGIDPQFDRHFDYVTRDGGPHPDKLNSLARVICQQADPSDLIVFLDGDAFPVRPLDRWFEELLAERPLAAVRRDENAGDIQPHPCFCITTTGFWTAVQGDWRPGAWVTNEGIEASDVGGKLLTILNERGVAWRPVLRSNTCNLHPVLYGLYEGHLYHHGAGFRPPIARADQSNVPVAENEEYLYLRTQTRGKSIKDLRPRHVGRLLRLGRDGVRARKLNAYMRQEERRSEEIYKELCNDPGFYRRLERSDPSVHAPSLP